MIACSETDILVDEFDLRLGVKVNMSSTYLNYNINTDSRQSNKPGASAN